MDRQPYLTLNDGRSMPQLGFGVWQVPRNETCGAVERAISDGYRLIDTAEGYGNEAEVGEAVARCGVERGELFVTTKLINDNHGYDKALRAFDASLKRLGMEHVDLYLIHWPRPDLDLYVETWKALVRLRDEGRARSIGVSNFTQSHVDLVIAETGVVPAVNQIELHPRFQQQAMREYHQRHGIVTQSWSPLGRGGLNDDPVVTGIARKHGLSWAQVALRWNLQLGLSVVTKSVTPARIAENFAVLGARLDDDDMARIAALDDPAGRKGPDPDQMAR